jgi:hypothetical protein
MCGSVLAGTLQSPAQVGADLPVSQTEVAQETEPAQDLSASGLATIPLRADVAELVDAHGSGPCGSNPVEVQVLSSA